MQPHSLTNFETHKYYENEPQFNGVYSRNNLPKIKYGTYIVNLDEFESVGTHWLVLYVNGIYKISCILTALELSMFQQKFKNS